MIHCYLMLREFYELIQRLLLNLHFNSFVLGFCSLQVTKLAKTVPKQKVVFSAQFVQKKIKFNLVCDKMPYI